MKFRTFSGVLGWAGALVILAGTLFSGCSASSDSIGIPSPHTTVPDQRRWFDVFHVESVENELKEEHVGYLYAQMSGDDVVYYVRNLMQEDLGFMLDDFSAFRFTKEYDPSTGRLERVRKPLGKSGREGGVKRILDLNSGQVVIREVQLES